MDNLEQTYREAVAAVREKDFYRGRGLLKEVLRQDPTHVMAHLWYARATDDPERQRKLIERAVKLDPTNEHAQKMLAKLNAPAQKPPPGPKLEPLTPIPAASVKAGPGGEIMTSRTGGLYRLIAAFWSFVALTLTCFTFFVAGAELLDPPTSEGTIAFVVVMLTMGYLSFTALRHTRLYFIREVTVRYDGLIISDLGNKLIPWSEMKNVKYNWFPPKLIVLTSPWILITIAHVWIRLKDRSVIRLPATMTRFRELQEEILSLYESHR